MLYSKQFKLKANNIIKNDYSYKILTLKTINNIVYNIYLLNYM